MLGRYFSEKDISFINLINDELLGDVIQQVVTLHRPCADVSTTNIYGEVRASVGMTYFPGIDIICLVERADIDTPIDDFGPTRSQNVVFKFMEKDLEKVNFFPQSGDLIFFNSRYYAADNIIQGEQLLGGQPDKSFAVIVHCHYTKLSAINFVKRQS